MVAAEARAAGSKSTTVSQLSAWWPGSAHDPQHALQTDGGLAEQWCMDDGDTKCHTILMQLFLQNFDVANARVGAERNPLKNGSHLQRE